MSNDVYLQTDNSSVDGVTGSFHLKTTKADGTQSAQKANIAATINRQMRRSAPTDHTKAWQMASTPYNPWGYQLKDPIKLDPEEIYRDTSIPVTGFAGGSTIYIEAGKLIDAGMNPDIILGGVTADDIDELIAKGDLELDIALH